MLDLDFRHLLRQLVQPRLSGAAADQLGKPGRRSWKRSSPTRRSTRSTAGTTCAAALQPADRRCFAFFHPAMPDEPLIFVEVALTSGIPGIGAATAGRRTRDIWRRRRPTRRSSTRSRTARPGLRGISFGNSLIKQVVDGSEPRTAEPEDLRHAVAGPGPDGAGVRTSRGPGSTRSSAEATSPPRRLAAHYLPRRKTAAGGRRDPVARFHLATARCVHDVHADADTSPNGHGSNRGGAMVNYLYDLATIDAEPRSLFATSRRASRPRPRCAALPPAVHD